MELGNVFYEFALLLAAAGVLGFVAHWLKQPLVVAFIAVGILVEVALETTTEPSRGFDRIVFGLGRFGNHISRKLKCQTISSAW